MLDKLTTRAKKTITRLPTFFVLFGYGLINVFFNFKLYWSQLFHDNSKIGKISGEIQSYEWLLSQFYENLQVLQNPFLGTDNILYPFGMDFIGQDIGNGLYFLLLRPFFSPHQSLALIVVIGLFLANVGMYLLLKKMGFKTLVSFLIGLAYGYMTFLTPRLSTHLNFASIYLFPWFYLSGIILLQSKKTKIKVISSLAVASILVLTLWINAYYFITLLLSILFLTISFFLVDGRKIIKTIISNLHYGLLIGISVLIFLFPWLKVIYDVFLFDIPPKISSWGGAIEHSSDLFNFIIPSIYNFYYYPFAYFLAHRLQFASNLFENFTYPGIIILASYLSLFLFRKKISKKTKYYLRPFLISSTGFIILTLGPFLHIAGRWWLQLEDGVRLILPLPFAIFRYIPLVSNLRAPGRLIVGFIFFAYIVSAYLLSDFLKKRSDKFLIFFTIIFIFVFVIDQRYGDPPPLYKQNYSFKIFNEIKKDNEDFSVLEIPFSVRDGLTYFGDYYSTTMIIGQSVYKKPIVGGYVPRIADYKKKYYQNGAFTGYIGRLIDKELSKNKSISGDDKKSWNNPDIQASTEQVELLSIKYVILDDSKHYSKLIAQFLSEIEYEKHLTDNGFSLWKRNLLDNEFLISDIENNLLLGLGWNDYEDGFRWSDQKASVMFKMKNPRPLNLNVKMQSFFQPQQLEIYLNKKKATTIEIDLEAKGYTIPLSQGMIKGINTIHFIFQKSFRVSDVVDKSLDNRKIAGKFISITLEDD